MSDPRKPSELEDLDARLAAARAEQRALSGSERESEGERASAHGWAWRVAIEMVVAVAVGGAVGWYLDRWLGTLPLFLILLFFLGAGAGVNNVVRAAKEMNRAAAEEDARVGGATAPPDKETDGTGGNQRT